MTYSSLRSILVVNSACTQYRPYDARVAAPAMAQLVHAVASCSPVYSRVFGTQSVWTTGAPGRRWPVLPE